MNELIPLQFDRPGWLFLLLLVIPVFFLARRSIGGLNRFKSTITFAFRVLVIMLLSISHSGVTNADWTAINRCSEV